jgi:condensin complex subunit 1
MAELLEMLEKEFDYGQLGEEVLRDVAAKTSFAKEDVKGPRSFSRFLVKMAEGGVRGVQKQMPLLLVQLDNEVSTTSYNSGCADSRPTRCEWPSSKSSVS